MKPIETVYKGFKFRSRLEAKWAIFLTELGIEWLYEHEGYQLDDGTYYLPDFFLPKFHGGMFVEVKPQVLSIEENQKCRDLCFESGYDVWRAEGVPDIKGYVCLTKHQDDKTGDFEVIYYYGIPNADSAEGKNIMMIEPGYVSYADGSIADQYHSCLGNTFLKAVKKAKQARFEHGENGSYPKQTRN